MNTARLAPLIVLLFGLIGVPAAHALCLNPETLASGYRVPLADELRASQGEIIGKIEKVVPLQEDRTDPRGVTAYLYTIYTLRRLKGQVPSRFTVKVENDSGRYVMDTGKRHLLFLSAYRDGPGVNSCGNSSPLPAGTSVLRRVEALLAHAP